MIKIDNNHPNGVNLANIKPINCLSLARTRQMTEEEWSDYGACNQNYKWMRRRLPKQEELRVETEGDVVKRFKTFRKKNHITQMVAASMLSVSTTIISDLECGHGVSEGVMLKIERLLEEHDG